MIMIMIVMHWHQELLYFSYHIYRHVLAPRALVHLLPYILTPVTYWQQGLLSYVSAPHTYRHQIRIAPKDLVLLLPNVLTPDTYRHLSRIGTKGSCPFVAKRTDTSHRSAPLTYWHQGLLILCCQTYWHQLRIDTMGSCPCVAKRTVTRYILAPIDKTRTPTASIV